MHGTTGYCWEGQRALRRIGERPAYFVHTCEFVFVSRLVSAYLSRLDPRLCRSMAQISGSHSKDRFYPFNSSGWRFRSQARVDELFAVDAEARRKTLTTAARHIRRQQTARPLLDDIHSKIEAARSAALPSSALSKACQYALALWKKLTRFLEYPELELSTNLAENSMRPVALGRNYAQSAIMDRPRAA